MEQNEPTPYEQLQARITSALTSLSQQEGFVKRNAQRHMIGHIARTLFNAPYDTHPVIAIEAGTGTGKTYGYCLPLIPMVQFLEKQLVISTATVALQEQLIAHDLPLLRAQTGWEFSFVLAKGRRRYLCPLRMLSAVSGKQQALFESTDLIQNYATKLKVDMENGWGGDLDQLTYHLPETVAQAFTTDAAGCTNRKCQHFDICPYFKAKAAMSDANVVVTNHALLIADLNLGGGIVLPSPRDSYHVIDEGHQLADTVLSQAASAHQLQGARTWLDSLVKMTHAMSSRGDEDYQTDIGNWPERIVERAESLKRVLQQLYALLSQHAEFTRDNPQQSFGNKPERLINRYRFAHGQLPELFNELGSNIFVVSQALSDALSKASDLTQQALNRFQHNDLIKQNSDLAFYLERTDNIVNTWQLLLNNKSNPPIAKWLETHQKGDSVDHSFAASPIEAASYLHEKLWQTSLGVVITSATLTALGQFEYFLNKTGLNPETTITHRFASPFNYHANATLSIPNNIDGSNPAEHTEQVIEWLQEHIDPDEGTLILCTSKRQLNQIHDAIEADFSIQLQDTATKQHLIEQHKRSIDEGKGSILMGLDSFGEGLNLPGKYCTHVVICKLPFNAPDSPVEEAQAEYIESQGKRPFEEITVPYTSAKLTQWAGRLLRTETDTGRVSILDNRLKTKSYGIKMVAALPPFRHI